MPRAQIRRRRRGAKPQQPLGSPRFEATVEITRVRADVMTWHGDGRRTNRTGTRVTLGAREVVVIDVPNEAVNGWFREIMEACGARNLRREYKVDPKTGVIRLEAGPSIGRSWGLITIDYVVRGDDGGDEITTTRAGEWRFERLERHYGSPPFEPWVDEAVRKAVNRFRRELVCEALTFWRGVIQSLDAAGEPQKLVDQARLHLQRWEQIHEKRKRRRRSYSSSK